MSRKKIDKLCPLSRTLAVVGDSWSLIVLRDLMNGVTRFGEFATREKISPTVLSARLKHLEEHGVIERHLYSERPPRAEYRLTEKGQALGPMLLAMRDWGRAYTS